LRETARESCELELATLAFITMISNPAIVRSTSSSRANTGAQHGSMLQQRIKG
jgi:hypothetical protein